jgi:hypothetical protein
MRRRYYLVSLRVGGRDTYGIWSTEHEKGEESIFPYDLGEDRLLLDDTGLLNRFSDAETAKRFAAAAGIRIMDEPPDAYDFDQLERFITNEDEGTVPSRDCLDAWNLFVDLARSASPQDVAFLNLVEENLDVYDKLFEGTDIPAHHKALPVRWASDELARLRKVLSLGRQALSSRLRD